MRGSGLVLAALLGFAGVALGAFGAHGLKEHLSVERMATWNTAVLYHLVHALALLATAALPVAGGVVRVARWAFALGVLLFSGSLYLLALTDVRGFGAVTPFGGAAFLVGWAALLCAARRAA